MLPNLINFIFINFILITVIFGSLINLIEKELPVFIINCIRFGKHSYQGPKNKFINLLEVPKSWYKHFYIFAMLWSLSGFGLYLWCIIVKRTAPAVIINIFDLISVSENRSVLSDTTSGLLALTLLTLQCVRRCYETQFVQIFSSSNKMNFSQYLVGYIHYFGAVIAILLYTEGFVQGTPSTGFKLGNITLGQFICIVLFLFSWLQQYKSNIILANLRKNSEGKIITEKHLLPEGGYFEYVSSPHMLFEILMYVAIFGIIPFNITWRYVTIWVISNQTETAWLTHKWYKENFRNYPEKRFAIYPFVL